MYTKLVKKMLVNQQIIRTPKGMTYRVVSEDREDYGYAEEYWAYLNREGGWRR